MKPQQLEILLFTNTKFSSFLLTDKNDNNEKASECSDLEEAAWNGFYKEALPELYGEDRESKKMILWQTNCAENFLVLDYAESPQSKDPFFSIDPYYFMDKQLLS
ncbi:MULTISPECIES: hypothetical protein [Niastella]|uniref:Uncharacterized protein n=1 Tax=Niastella soli TaxID=2821487 RepID=A0ABS3YUE9_9BACT|nr:hypothetical protein [Niastella soli]MBO9201559.1 hypothetical protein [Niastella soli]